MRPVRIDRLLERTHPVFSFEFFPPETDEGMAALFGAIEALHDTTPTFVSVTCRNHSRLRTLELVTRIRAEMGLEPMAHYTCAGATRAELDRELRALCDAGIDNVLALRGDPPRGEDHFVPVEGGLDHGSDLVRLVQETCPELSIGAACYPEGHPESASLDEDLRYTVLKVRSGAAFLITQLFFDNAAYFDFVERARAAGIGVPIIPGIMPITTARQLARFEGKLFGASVPADLRDALLRCDGDGAAVFAVGVAWSIEQCTGLLAGGAPGVHFYTLNRSPATRAVLERLQASRPWAAAPAAP